MICHTPRGPSFASTMIAAFRNFKSAKTVSKQGFKDPSIRLHDLPSPKLFSGELPDPQPKKTEASNVISFRPKHPVVAALERNGGSVSSNRELARLQGISEGESSKRVQEVSKLLTVERDGKQMRISLKQSA